MADAVYTFGADVSALTKSLQQVADNTNTMANSLTGVMGRVGMAFQGAQAIAQTALSAINKALDACLEPARKLEEAATKLGKKLGDMEFGKELTDQLALDSANGTKSLEELTRAAGSLGNTVGASHLREWVGVLHDISEGSGVSMDALTRAFNKVSVTGVATQKELLPLLKADAGILDAFAQELGVTAQEVPRAMREGEISADKFQGALKRLTAEGGRYNTMAADMSNTGRGSVNTMWASMELALGKIGDVFNKVLTPIYQAISQWIQEVIPKIETAMTRWYQAVKPTIGSLMEFGAALWDVIESLGSVVGELLKTPLALGEATNKFSSFKLTVDVLAGALRVVAVILKGIAQIVNIISFGWVVDAIRAKDAEVDAARQRRQEIERNQRERALEQQKIDLEQAEAEEKKAEEAWQEWERRQQELTKKRRANSEQVTDDLARRWNKGREKLWDAMDPAAAIDSILGSVYKSSKKELLEAMDSYNYGMNGELTDGQKAEYDDLSRALDRIEKQEERQQKLLEERKKILREITTEEEKHAAQRAWQAAQEGGLTAQERYLRDELARVGSVGGEDVGRAATQRIQELAKEDAKGNREAIGQLKELRSMWEDLTRKKAEYARTQVATLEGLQADVLEVQGQTGKANAMREEQAIAARIEELRNAGASKRIAKEQALLEAEVKKVREIDSMAKGLVAVGTSGAGYGNGYYARILGGDQLSETRKTNQLLGDLKGLCQRIANKKTSTTATLA